MPQRRFIEKSDRDYVFMVCDLNRLTPNIKSTKRLLNYRSSRESALGDGGHGRRWVKPVVDKWRRTTREATQRPCDFQVNEMMRTKKNISLALFG